MDAAEEIMDEEEAVVVVDIVVEDEAGEEVATEAVVDIITAEVHRKIPIRV